MASSEHLRRLKWHDAARVQALDWFSRRGGRAGDTLWLGQWDHGSGCCPTRRGIQWTSGTRYDMQPSRIMMAHHPRAGHRLVLRVTTSDPDKVPMFAGDPQVTVFTGPGATAVELAVVPEPTLYPDTVPLEVGGEPSGPAQAPVTGSVTTGAPGVRTRTDATSSYLECEVPEGVDDAKPVVEATATLPADLDLYRQRKQADGTWAADAAAGASAELTARR